MIADHSNIIVSGRGIGVFFAQHLLTDIQSLLIPLKSLGVTDVRICPVVDVSSCQRYDGQPVRID
jgi:hypothetical protein